MTQFPGYDKFKFLKLWCFISQSVEHFMLTKILKSTMAWKGTYLEIFKKLTIPRIVLSIGTKSFSNSIAYEKHLEYSLLKWSKTRLIHLYLV